MEQMIMASLLTLTPHQFSDLTHSLSSDLRIQHHRRCSLLLSPARFSNTLFFLNSLSLHQKTILIARYLLTTLKQLTHTWDYYNQHQHTSINLMRLRDFDAVLLLMLLCEVSQYNSEGLESSSSASKWIDVVRDYSFSNMLTLSDIGCDSTTILGKYIDISTRCWRFLQVTGCGGGCCGCCNKEREMGTSAAAVVSLPSVAVEISSSSSSSSSPPSPSSPSSPSSRPPLECVICREEMRQGRDVCQLPCKHLFHWACVLPWLKAKNTCPCCRFQLPTDDIFGEIKRLWGILLNKECSVLHP